MGLNCADEEEPVGPLAHRLPDWSGSSSAGHCFDCRAGLAFRHRVPLHGYFAVLSAPEADPRPAGRWTDSLVLESDRVSANADSDRRVGPSGALLRRQENDSTGG